MKRYLSSGIFIAFLLAGCGTTVGDTLTGSALGAGAGAAIGSTMHETKKGAAAGAGAGALAGFLVHKAGEQLLRDEDLGPDAKAIMLAGLASSKSTASEVIEDISPLVDLASLHEGTGAEEIGSVMALRSPRSAIDHEQHRALGVQSPTFLGLWRPRPLGRDWNRHLYFTDSTAAGTSPRFSTASVIAGVALRLSGRPLVQLGRDEPSDGRSAPDTARQSDA